MWLYRKDEGYDNSRIPQLVTHYNVGFFHPSSHIWQTVESYTARDSAQQAVNYLNGGTGASK